MTLPLVYYDIFLWYGNYVKQLLMKIKNIGKESGKMFYLMFENNIVYYILFNLLRHVLVYKQNSHEITIECKL